MNKMLTGGRCRGCEPDICHRSCSAGMECICLGQTPGVYRGMWKKLAELVAAKTNGDFHYEYQLWWSVQEQRKP